MGMYRLYTTTLSMVIQDWFHLSRWFGLLSASFDIAKPKDQLAQKLEGGKPISKTDVAGR